MNFRTQDKQYIAKLRKTIIEESSNPSAWQTVHNQLYIDDMMEYIRSLSTTPVVCGTGSYTPSIAIVSFTYTDSVITNVKNHIRDRGISIENIWVTSLIKSISVCQETLLKYTIEELKQLQPSTIVLLGLSPHMNVIESSVEKFCNTVIYLKNLDSLKDALDDAFKSCNLL